jgi:hypothetical protein
MSFLDRIAGIFTGQKSGSSGSVRDENGFYFYVRCGKCGEVVRVRTDRRWDFQQEFEEGQDAPTGYAVHKEVIGQRCFQMIHVTLRFDSHRRETGREIRGGQFATEQEYEAQAAPGPA